MLTDSTIIINGEVLTFSVPTVSVQGRTMVPMREIFEKLGFLLVGLMC